MNGRDVLVVLPTGFGNYLIFHAVREDFCWKLFFEWFWSFCHSYMSAGKYHPRSSTRESKHWGNCLFPIRKRSSEVCKNIHRNFCLQRQRTFKMPFKIKNFNFRRCSDWFIFPPKSSGRNITFNGIVAGFPSFPRPSPLSPPFPQSQESLLRRLIIRRYMECGFGHVTGIYLYKTFAL